MLRKMCMLCLGIVMAVATVPTDALALDDSEKVFYKDHPDAFIQKMFIDDPNKALLRPSQIFLSALAYFIPAVLAMALMELSNLYGHHDENRSLMMGSLIGILSQWLYIKYARSLIEKEAFCSFIAAYNNGDNVKQYLTSNLSNVFDAMFQKYQKQGDDYFASDEFDEMVELIHNEIVKENSAYIDRQTNQALIMTVCITAITLITISWFALNNMQRGLRQIQNHIEYLDDRSFVSSWIMPRYHI